MASILFEQAVDQMQRQRYSEALFLFHRVIERDPTDWNSWYLAGQCCRFLNDIDGAIIRLKHASVLASDAPPVFLALGIAYQLASRWAEAIEALARAIDLDPDFELAYNSLALTQKKAGELEKALHNYDAGVKALSRRLLKGMTNSRNSPILKHRDTAGSLWVEYVVYAGLHVASSEDGIDAVAWPTSAQATEEERTEEHAGLFWTDMSTDTGETVRLFLPNFFNTLRESFRLNLSYSKLIGNRGTVLELLGRADEAERHFDEASEFLP